MKASKRLEEIKNSWQELSKDRLKKDITAGEVRKMIRQKSKGELTKIKRKLLIETVLSAVLLPFMLVYIHRLDSVFAYMTDAFLVIYFGALAFPTMRILRIGRLKNQETIIFLRKFVYHFRKAIKTGAIILVVLFPVYFIASFVMGFVKGYESAGNSAPFDLNAITGLDGSTILIGAAIIVLVLLVIGFLFLIKLYYMLMYGKHVKNLKSFLAELEKHEAEDNLEKRPASS